MESKMNKKVHEEDTWNGIKNGECELHSLDRILIKMGQESETVAYTTS